MPFLQSLEQEMLSARTTLGGVQPIPSQPLASTAPEGQDTKASAGTQHKHAAQTGAQAEAREELGCIADDKQCCGFLDRVPHAWLHQWIRSLPNSSKALLFASSRQLAKQVLGSSPTVTLVLVGGQKLTAELTEVRQGILTRLLSEQQQLTVHLNPESHQPFPFLLAGQVTSLVFMKPCRMFLSESEPRPQCVPDALGCQWSAMTNLHTLCFESAYLHPEDISGLCAAVQAGHLRQLRTFEISSARQFKNMDCLARVVGPQLESVDVSWEIRKGRLRFFTALQRLTVRVGPEDGAINSAFMQELCAHSSLRHVVFHDCYLEDHQVHHSHPKWETVTLHFPEAKHLLLLPLACVQQVCIARGVCFLGTSSSQALRDTLTELACKTVCQSDVDSHFTLVWPCQAAIPLIQRLRRIETLTVHDLDSLDDLTHIWQALPECVSHICLHGVRGILPGQLWQGLPQHVSSCTLQCCFVPPKELRRLVQGTPSHVHSLAMLTNKQVHAQGWLDAGLRALAPAHVHITLGLSDHWTLCNMKYL